MGADDIPDLDALYQATQGWPAGVALALRRSRMRSHGPASTASGAQGIFDYLAAEVFDQLEESIRWFLLNHRAALRRDS